MNFVERFKYIIGKRGVTVYRVAKDLGISEPAVRGWKNGRALPGSSNALALAQYLGVSPAWLLHGEGPEQVDANVQRVPVVETAEQIGRRFVTDGAGPGEFITLPGMPLEAFAFKVSDEAMSPTLRTGDYIVFVETTELRNGDMTVLADEYGALHVRRFRKLHGESLLTAENKDYPVVKVGEGFEIVGKALKVWRELGF